MDCSTSNLLEILAIAIACLALFATLVTVRYQVIAIIYTQLSDKAKEVNSYLKEGKEVPKSAAGVSGIVSSIITAKELLSYQRTGKYFLLWLVNWQSLTHQFYLQLHTSIRVWLQKNSLTNEDIEDQALAEIIAQQFLEARSFLQKSIEKD